MTQIFEEFKKTDQFYDRFKTAFKADIIDVILEFHPEFKQKNILQDLVLLYAIEIISATESVIDKDLNYPEFRKIEELNYMNRIINRESVIVDENDFLDRLHQKAKKQIVNFYPKVYDLSNHGFRLLEQNAKMYLFGFIAQFYSFLKDQ